MKLLVLIDAHAIIHRAFHALPPLSAPDGTPTNAAYGFTSVFLKMLRELKPDYLIAAFDHPAPTFRHVAFARYKATRVKAPDELYRQIPLVREILAAFGVPALDREGFEADDVIGTVVKRVRRGHPNVEIVIVTGDLDTLQLVDARTKVFTMRKGVADTVLYDEALVRERYGLAPKQLVDFKGLRGDPSDNIPGVRGIGEKTAAELIQRYGAIEAIYQALKDKKKPFEAKPGIIAALRTHEADALFSKTLGTIHTNVPVKFELAAARFRNGFADRPAVTELFGRLGFESLLRRMSGVRVHPPAAVQATLGAIAGVTVHEAKGFTALPRQGHAVVIPDPAAGSIFVVTEPGAVSRIPFGQAAFRGAEKWFHPARPTYIYDRKALLGHGLPADAAGARDLMLIWWVGDPGRRTYEAAGLAAREFRGRAFADTAEVAAALFSAAPSLEERLRKEELWAVYEGMEYPLTPLLHAMEERGIGFDPKPLRLLSREMASEIAALETSIHGSGGEQFNINSPRQLSRILFEKLGLAARGLRQTDKGGVVSTRESELAKLKGQHPIVADILRYRELAKLKSTYVDALPALARTGGRIHTTWNQTGTATGRLSSRDPNLQNIPIRSVHGKTIRSAFVADPGFLLVAFDYSQLELRIAAELACDEKMIDAFRRGLDIHRLTAAEVNNLTLADVTPELRRKAKALNFGILYGMGSRAFAESAGISRDEAEHFIEEYFHDFQGIARFITETKEQARTHRFTKTAFGRKRFFPNMEATNFRLQREAERMAVNHPIQGSAADIVKKAMIAADAHIARERLGNAVRMLLQVHDELVFEIRKESAGKIIPAIRGIMEGAWQGKVTMKVETKQGPHWGALE